MLLWSIRSQTSFVLLVSAILLWTLLLTYSLIIIDGSLCLYDLSRTCSDMLWLAIFFSTTATTTTAAVNRIRASRRSLIVEPSEYDFTEIDVDFYVFTQDCYSCFLFVAKIEIVDVHIDDREVTCTPGSGSDISNDTIISVCLVIGLRKSVEPSVSVKRLICRWAYWISTRTIYLSGSGQISNLLESCVSCRCLQSFFFFQIGSGGWTRDS